MRHMTMELGKDSYDILLEPGIISKAKEYLNLNRKCFIVTDSGVPSKYVEVVASQCKEAVIGCFEQGEASKNIQTYTTLLTKMIKNNFSRKDCVIAIGGGVVGDLAGFVASSYMRGIDFYNIPTTTLAQLDSSIGGKVAIDMANVKNVVGAFYQPKRVLIDIDTLKTQTHRQFVNGLAEAIKMGIIYDNGLFELFKDNNATDKDKLEEIIYRSLIAKKLVVEQDEKELGIRKILNFGHTIGHGIESSVGLGQLLHGECVGLGMILITEDEKIKKEIKETLERYDLPTSYPYDKEKVFEALAHDKKASSNKVSKIVVKEIGKAEIEEVEIESLKGLL